MSLTMAPPQPQRAPARIRPSSQPTLGIQQGLHLEWGTRKLGFHHSEPASARGASEQPITEQHSSPSEEVEDQPEENMEFVAIVIILALIQYFLFASSAGAARAKYEIEAPATTGHPDFERKLRVQQNTLEQLVIFIPSIWFFGLYVSPFIAGLLGIGFIVGRFVYGKSYVAEPSQRTVGFMITFASEAILAIGALIGAIVRWLA